jgi:hypothetical protein
MNGVGEEGNRVGYAPVPERLSPDAIEQADLGENQGRSGADAGHLEEGQRSRLMDGVNRLDCRNGRLFNDDNGDQVPVDRFVVVMDGKPLPAGERNGGPGQRPVKAALVNRFGKSWAEGAMNLDGAADDADVSAVTVSAPPGFSLPPPFGRARGA